MRFFLKFLHYFWGESSHLISLRMNRKRMNIIHQNGTWTEQDCWKVLTRLVGLVSDSMESLIFFLVTTCIRMSINGNCSYLLIFSVVIYQQAIDFKDLDKFLYKFDIISYIIEANLVINALSDLVNGVH